ncbi:MAG: hypothetical protein ACFFCW_34985 [Candidatus Hodarchaeota archaeon]
MVENVQKKSVGQNDDHSDTWTVNPKTIIFERLVNLGNYENVRFGGEFIIPEKYTRKQALSEIVSLVIKEIEVYRQKEVDLGNQADYQLENTKNFLEDYIKRIKAKTSVESEELKKKLLTAQLERLGTALKDLRSVANSLNQHIRDIYALANSILQDTNFSLRDVVDSWTFPDEFSFEIKKKDDVSVDDDVEDEDEDEYD